MSSETTPRRHRHTRSAVIPSAAASSQNPQNPHLLNLNSQARARNTQADVNMNYNNSTLQPSTPPRTPHRNGNSGPQNNAHANAPETGSKQKSRNKNRPKNVITSPAAVRKGRRTPPTGGPQSARLPVTKALNTPSAYAGAAFHASPAPSALPIPSFYSKSVPDSPGLRGPQAPKDSPFLRQVSTPPQVEASTKRFQREESPLLDMLFNADRADKARARSATSEQAVNGPFQPPTGTPRTSHTPPITRSQTRPVSLQSKRASSSGMFAMEELDGEDDPGTPLGPAFSTPYLDRINAARSGSQSLTPSSPVTPKLQDSAAMKAFLFSDLTPPNTNLSNGSSYTPQQAPQTAPRSIRPNNRSQNNSFSPDTRNSSTSRPCTRSSGLRQEVTPTKTPERNNDSGNLDGQPQRSRNSGGKSDFDLIFGGFNTTSTPKPPAPTVGQSDAKQQAEDALRKILKLDGLSVSGSSSTNIGNLPQASVSVPNYVGSRPPPMNGLHNGVMRS